jgi:hypothetical protein
MKCICFLLFLFVFSIANINAEEINYGWSLGTLWIHYNFSENKFNADIDILHFNWLLYNKFILGFNLVSVQGSAPNDEKSYITVLPMEAAFVPLIYNFSYNHQLGLSFYGKIGWELTSYKDKEQLENGFYASIGSQLFLQFTEPNSRSPYSRYLSLYVDYNFFRGLKFGFSVDVTPVVLWLILFNNDRE